MKFAKLNTVYSKHPSVAVIGTVGVPANYGGFETFVEYLTKELNGKIPLTVYCSSRSYPNKLKKHNGARLEYVPLHANGFQSIPYDILSLFRAARRHDTILILGVSGCIILPVFRLFYPRKRLIANLDGLEHLRDKWNAFIRVYLKLSERIAIRHADEIIADNRVIQRYYQQVYNRESILITYGGDHSGNTELSESVRLKFGLASGYAFGVCRIEPENNIHLILNAFSRVDMPLVIMGNWESSDYGRKLRQEYSSSQNIRMLDPVYELNILDQIRSNCRVYVHGHSAGGTNPSLVEAMSLSLPVFAYDAAFNRESTSCQAKYFKNPDELYNLILSCSGEQLEEMGQALGRIASEQYLWLVIAEKYAEVFTGTVI